MDTTEVKSYLPNAEGTPLEVVVGGVIYRAETDQVKARLDLRAHELLEEIGERFGADAKTLAGQLEDVVSDACLHEQEQIRQELLRWLPQHAEVVEDLFAEGRLGVDTYLLHKRCLLPSAG